MGARRGGRPRGRKPRDRIPPGGAVLRTGANSVNLRSRQDTGEAQEEGAGASA